MNLSTSPGVLCFVAPDETITELLQNPLPQEVSYTAHFNQAEEFFLKLDTAFQVPSFPIHHDVRLATPGREYQKAIQSLLQDLYQLLPEIFQGLRYAFDPREILRPVFYKLFRLEGRHYLFHLRLDISFRPTLHRVIEKGSNDQTPRYESNLAPLEASLLPLADPPVGEEPRELRVDQLISDTWIGETGRGYFVEGIWIDNDLTKFFSRLVIPRGKRLYPYYPLTSRFRTLSHTPLDLRVQERPRAVPLLHKTRLFLEPHLEAIQQTLRSEPFSEDLPLFQELKELVPEDLQAPWQDISLRAYLNQDDMKEFEVHLPGAPA
ncbi:hypothetical protein SAMN05920897_101181 [Alkalispirochaeta americana]|uniref:Uncharacterized protein n=1 Tax=Alkalispirochaeta americana TaxID=159291 RepID=A0A1N6NC45_9SPIO|nr:hypothetical protein [Alkalispirochaeta americana]SIP89654.1 hypothetical protein SAMN05920897_101181 [Alkalispirochaeta americana]